MGPNSTDWFPYKKQEDTQTHSGRTAPRKDVEGYWWSARLGKRHGTDPSEPSWGTNFNYTCFSASGFFAELWENKLLCVQACGCRHATSIHSCLTLCDLMDCSPPGSSVHGILQARILEWVDISYSRRSSWPRDQICFSAFISCWAIGEASSIFTTQEKKLGGKKKIMVVKVKRMKKCGLPETASLIWILALTLILISDSIIFNELSEISF